MARTQKATKIELRDVITRDEVHGDVRLDPLAVALLDTTSLQRLGRVYQLGYSHLVYRGGTHTRLSHVIGAYHASSKLVDALRRNYSKDQSVPEGAISPDEFLPQVREKTWDLEQRWEALRCFVGWASLLHDASHIPLGHSLEDEFADLYTKHDSFLSPRNPFLWHESDQGYSEIYLVLTNGPLRPRFMAQLPIETIWQTVILTCFYKPRGFDQEQGKWFSREFEKTLGDCNLPTGLGGPVQADTTPQPSTGPGSGAGDHGGHSSVAPHIIQGIKDNAVRLRRFVEALDKAMTEVNDRLFRPYMADIVGDTICSDYMDYIQRDPKNLGLDVLRDDRVISKFWIGRDAAGQCRMALSLEDDHKKPRLDITTGVVELVRQRFRLAESVYYHKTKVAASVMLAKAMRLLGPLPEFRVQPQSLDGQLIEDILDEVYPMAGPRNGESAHRLVLDRTNLSLLDPGMGDESLLALLIDKAWHRFQEASSREEAKTILRAIRLLDGIVSRKLYKVCFSMDAGLFSTLCPGGKSDPRQIEKRLSNLIRHLRNDEETRDKLELKMDREVHDKENDIFLIYVPDRKSQAKGIETGALDNGEVVTLGKHNAVSSQVGELSKRYAELWKLIVFVNSDHREDAVGQSRAVDKLLRTLFSTPALLNMPEESGLLHKVERELRRHGHSTPVASGAWFPYVPERRREAAIAYEACCRELGQPACWRDFEESEGEEITPTQFAEFLALKAYAREQLSLECPEREFEEFGKVLKARWTESRGFEEERAAAGAWVAKSGRSEDIATNILRRQVDSLMKAFAEEKSGPDTDVDGKTTRRRSPRSHLREEGHKKPSEAKEAGTELFGDADQEDGDRKK